MKKLIAILLCVLAFTSCATAPKREKDNIRTWYEVFVYSFADSDDNGIGDLKGLTQKLDYIEGLGFDGIWLMPINPSTTYHKYDVIAYDAIDPQYGNMEDFDAFMSECAKRDIRVILDLVINHSSTQHPWFKNAIQALQDGDESNKYISYYNFVNSKPAAGGYSSANVDDWYYECMFWEGMPDLNLDNVHLRAELEDIMRFWLDKGVAGFRLDAVKEFYSGEPARNIEVLTWINAAAKAIKPDAYLVGENWDTSTAVYDYYDSGADSFFDFPFSGASGNIAKSLVDTTRPTLNFAQGAQQAQEIITSKNDKATNASFFTNHDSPRASGFLKRDAALIKMAWGMNLLQTGQAFMYYGEELGMSGSGKDENKRAPMYWVRDTGNALMCNGPPAMEAQKHTFAPASDQEKDKTSIYNFVKATIALRNKYPSIARGTVKALEIETPLKVCFIEKIYNGERIVLAYNLSSEEQSCDVSDIDVAKALEGVSHTNEKATLKGNTLILPAYSISVLQ